MATLHSIKGLEQRANLYHQVGTSLGAGIPLVETFQFLAEQSSGARRAPLAASVERLRKGSSLTEALRRSGESQPEFDVALLAAAEHSGHLDAACRRLGEHYAERAKIARQVRGERLAGIAGCRFDMAPGGRVRQSSIGASAGKPGVSTRLRESLPYRRNVRRARRDAEAHAAALS